MVKYCYCDIETSGTDKIKHAILQLSGSIEIDGEVKENFDWYIEPYPWQEIDPEAMKVNGIDLNNKDIINPKEALFRFKSILSKYVNFWDKNDKFFFVGYNAKFDYDFMREFFINGSITDNDRKYGNGFGNFFWVPPLDVMNMAAVKTRELRSGLCLNNFKLMTIAELFDIKAEGDYHNALVDIEVTRKLFKKLL